MEAPNYKFLSFFRANQKANRKFNYQPKYYDEDKEAFEKRKRAIERKVKLEKGEGNDDYVPSRSIKFSSASKSNILDYRKGKRAANIRLLIILALLVAFFVYGVGYLEDFQEFLKER